LECWKSVLRRLFNIVMSVGIEDYKEVLCAPTFGYRV